MGLVRGKKPGTDFYNGQVPHLGVFQSCAILLLSIHPEYELTGRKGQYQRLLEVMKMGQNAIEVSGGWQGNMKFAFTDGYGHELIVDAPEDDGDSFDGFMPAYMLLASLAACSGIDIANILKKQRQQLSTLKVNVRGVQAEDPPWQFNTIHLEYQLTGQQLSDDMVSKAIELSEQKYCSVGATIGSVATITSDYTVIQD